LPALFFESIYKQQSHPRIKVILMKPAIILAILLMLIVGCSKVENPGPAVNTTQTISGTQKLVLNEQDLQQLGMTGGTECLTEEQTSIDSLPVQYSFCAYNISSLNDTEIIIQLQEFTTFEDLNGTYQYDSLHLYSAQGLISENDYGDQSRFRVNNVNDYGGQYNTPGVYFYHLWICKDKFLIHITSKGTSKEAESYIAKIGQKILSKFG
jgi:hypothetical protein